MSFTSDIHGREWTPCPLCPRPAACPSRRHRGLCAALEADPPRWRPAILAMRPERRTHGPAAFRPARPDGRVRVGVLVDAIFNGGAEQWIWSLVRNTDPVRLQWVGLGIGSGTATSETRADLEAVVPLALGLDACRELAKACDVLVAWNMPDLADVLPSPRPPVIGVSHSDGHSEWGRQANATIDPVVNLWAGVSTTALEVVPESRRDSAVVIENAIDPDRLEPKRDRATMRQAWGVPESAKVLGFLGRLATEKDPDALNRTVAALPGVWWGVGVGDGHLESELRDAGPSRVRWVGADRDVGSVLGAFDAAVLPSEYESFGYAMLEAMASGVPLVSTSVGVVAWNPGCARLVPWKADGATLAAAVLGSGPDPTEVRARMLARYGPEPFGRAWSDLIVSMAPDDGKAARRAEIAEHLRLSRLAASCPHRKPIGDCRRSVRCTALQGDLHGGTVASKAGCVACVLRHGGAVPG
jgi:hypothetical protein